MPNKQRLHATTDAQRIAFRHAGRAFVDADNARQILIGASGDSPTIFSLMERIGHQAAGFMPSFATALKAGKLRPATALDLERFAHAQQEARAKRNHLRFRSPLQSRRSRVSCVTALPACVSA